MKSICTTSANVEEDLTFNNNSEGDNMSIITIEAERSGKRKNGHNVDTSKEAVTAYFVQGRPLNVYGIQQAETSHVVQCTTTEAAQGDDDADSASTDEGKSMDTLTDEYFHERGEERGPKKPKCDSPYESEADEEESDKSFREWLVADMRSQREVKMDVDEFWDQYIQKYFALQNGMCANVRCTATSIEID